MTTGKCGRGSLTSKCAEAGEIVNRHLVVEYWSTQGGGPILSERNRAAAYKNGGLAREASSPNRDARGKGPGWHARKYSAYKQRVLSEDGIMSARGYPACSVSVRPVSGCELRLQIKKGVDDCAGPAGGVM